MLFRSAARGRGVLVALHDLALAARHADRVALMQAGRLVAFGPPEAVLSPERLAAVYGIEAFRAETAEGPILVPTGLARP